MIITKSRTALITLATSAVLAVAGLAPAASQAQWHTYCNAGSCITHSNYTLAGVHACGPGDFVGAGSTSGSSSWTEPTTSEAKAAQAEQQEITQFEGGCAD